MWFGFKGITDDGLAHHSCGFLFGVLHDDSDRLSDIFNKVIDQRPLAGCAGLCNKCGCCQREEE